MRFTNIQYLEGEGATVSIHNLNVSRTILDGQVVFAISHDEIVTNAAATPPTSLLRSLGVDVQTATDAATNITNNQGLCVGIAKINPTTTNISTTGQASLPVGGVTEAVCYGFTDAIYQVRTRATSTDVWATTNGVAGDQIIPETVNNNLKYQGTLALSAARVQFVLAQSVSAASISYASGTINTNANSTATVETARLKVRVCCM